MVDASETIAFKELYTVGLGYKYHPLPGYGTTFLAIIEVQWWTPGAKRLATD